MSIQPVLFLLLARSSHAYTLFDTTCTIPKVQTNFVSSPNTRGTLDILWSCVFTIIACTWTIQHLNIPEPRDDVSERMDRRHWRFHFRKVHKGFFSGLWYDVKDGAGELGPDFVWSIGRFWMNFKWMLFTIFLPEYILGKAIGDFVSAWKLKEEMEYWAIQDNVEWGLSHSFFALMGGFRAIAMEQPETKNKTTASSHDDGGAQVEEHGQQYPDTTSEVADQLRKSSPSREKPDHQLTPSYVPNSKIDGQDIADSYILSGGNILQFRSRGVIERLPGITMGEIHDKGTSNIFVKVVAVGQVLWVAVQVIVRSVKGLTISQLELMTTAFSLCAIITYLCLLQKPQGIQIPERPMKVKLDRLGSLPWPPEGLEWNALRVLFIPDFVEWEGLVMGGPRARVPNDFVDDENTMAYVFGIAIGGVIFGAIHVAGWNLSFPTSIDQELWRISSILMTCLLPIACFPVLTLLYVAAKHHSIVDFIDEHTVHTPYSYLALIIKGWGFIFGILYIAARLILLVETFRTLAFLPPDTFVSTWVSNIPNVS